MNLWVLPGAGALTSHALSWVVTEAKSAGFEIKTIEALDSITPLLSPGDAVAGFSTRTECSNCTERGGTGSGRISSSVRFRGTEDVRHSS
jgi:hypothetical protein